MLRFWTKRKLVCVFEIVIDFDVDFDVDVDVDMDVDCMNGLVIQFSLKAELQEFRMRVPFCCDRPDNE